MAREKERIKKKKTEQVKTGREENMNGSKKRENKRKETKEGLIHCT